MVVKTRCFSEAGMGKDEGDANGAIIKMTLKRKRGQGNGAEYAGDILTQSTAAKTPGQTRAVAILSRSNEDGGIERRIPINRNYGLWTVSEETATF